MSPKRPPLTAHVVRHVDLSVTDTADHLRRVVQSPTFLPDRGRIIGRVRSTRFYFRRDSGVLARGPLGCSAHGTLRAEATTTVLTARIGPTPLAFAVLAFLCIPLATVLYATTTTLGFSPTTMACWLLVVLVVTACAALVTYAFRRGTADLVDVLDTALSGTVTRRE